MATKYSVVRYLPRPLSGEMINVGLIAWDGERIATKFVDNWRRVRAFGHEDISFLQDFARELETRTSPAKSIPGFGPNPLHGPDLEKLAGGWTHSIQFSEPKASLRSPVDVLKDVAPTFLPELRRPLHRPRDRRVAAMLAVQKVSELLTDVRGHEAHGLVKKQFAIKGKLDEHFFDVAVANDRTFFAAQGLSFEKTTERELQRDVDATAWTIDDVRKAHRTLPVAILALPPAGKSAPFERAAKVFSGLNVKMLNEQQIGTWVRRTIKETLTAN